MLDAFKTNGSSPPAASPSLTCVRPDVPPIIINKNNKIVRNPAYVRPDVYVDDQPNGTFLFYQAKPAARTWLRRHVCGGRNRHGDLVVKAQYVAEVMAALVRNGFSVDVPMRGRLDILTVSSPVGATGDDRLPPYVRQGLR